MSLVNPHGKDKRLTPRLLAGLELQAHRGLAQQRLAGRRGDAPDLGHGVEDAEVMEVHCRGTTRLPASWQRERSQAGEGKANK